MDDYLSYWIYGCGIQGYYYGNGFGGGILYRCGFGYEGNTNGNGSGYGAGYSSPLKDSIRKSNNG